MTIDEGMDAVSMLWRGQELWELLADAKVTRETLIRCQTECTSLLEANRALVNENRALRAQLNQVRPPLPRPHPDDVVLFSSSSKDIESQQGTLAQTLPGPGPELQSQGLD